MTLKDLLQLLRRRWLTAGLVFAAVFTGFMSYSAFTERAQFRARARVLISTPPLLISAQGNQYVSTNPLEPRTWVSIMGSRKVQQDAVALYRKRHPAAPVGPEWFATATLVPEPDSQLYWVEAMGPTAETAADIANTMAERIQEVSKEIAGYDMSKARENTSERLRRERDAQRAEELAARKIRNEARDKLNSDNLELDLRKTEEDVLSHESRRRDLERRAATNRLRIDRIRSDRSVSEHLQREGVVRLGSASVETRVTDNPQVRLVRERLEILHRDLLLDLRRHTEEHPNVKGLRLDIRQTELDLTRAQIQALGSDIDREDLALRTDNELIAIEIRVLQPEVFELRERITTLTPVVELVKAHDRAAQDSRTQAATLEALLAQLSAAPDSGYVRRLENDQAKADEAVRVELRLRKSWPVALLAAGIVGIAFAFLREFVDTSLRNDYDVRRHLDYPVLAVAPKVAPSEVLITRATRQSVLAEIYDTLATVLLSTPSERASRVFMVTSTNPQEGKTSVSCDLSIALARQGKRTLLIDADMRVPSVYMVMGLAQTPGLSDVLSGAVQPAADGLLQDCEVPNLRILASGISPENPYELLDPARVGPVVAQYREMFDVIVIDTPPVLRTGDALKLASVADSTLFVIEAGRTDQRQATWAKRLLTNVGARVAGVVLNRAETESEEYYYYYGHRGDSRKSARTV